MDRGREKESQTDKERVVSEVGGGGKKKQSQEDVVTMSIRENQHKVAGRCRLTSRFGNGKIR